MEKISRRDALKIGSAAATVGAAALVTKQAMVNGVQSPAVAAASVIEEKIVKTTCALCPSGCGLEVRVVNGRAVKVEGNPLHPLNQGVCCLKGQTALEILYSPERIERPRIQTGPRGGGDWKEISWDEALKIVAKEMSDLRDMGMPHTLAMVHGDTRGQMRNMIRRFMEAYGSPNVISRESLGEAAARQVMFLMQGIRGLPVYDLTNSNYVMAFGGNPLESGRSLISNLGAVAFMRRGRPQRGKLVAVHPRLGLTGIKADEWVPIRPGTYGALALGLANVIINSNLHDEAFLKDFCFGFEDFQDENGVWHIGFKRLALEYYPIERVASMTGIPAETIARLAGEFATNSPAVAILPTEPGEYNFGNGLYSAMPVHALNALVGSIDAPGGVLVQRYPPTREWPSFFMDEIAQDGLARERLDHAGSRDIPLATSAFQNLTQSILNSRPYPTNILFLLNTNPVYDLPDGKQFVEAMLKVPFVVSIASTLDETSAHADLILPASTFLEIWEDDYIEGTGYAGLSLRQPVVDPVYDTRSPGDILLQLAHLISKPVSEALPWKDYPSLVKFRLGSVEMDWEKFVANGCWSEMVYFNAAPGSAAWSSVVGRDRLNAPKDGRFDLFSRELFSLVGKHNSTTSVNPSKAFSNDLACLPHFDLPSKLDPSPREAADFPLLLISQSLITHSSTWNGIIPTLQEIYGLQTNSRWNSWVEMHPQIAEALGVEEGEQVWVESRTGRVQAKVRTYEGIWPNAVFMPPGQGHHTFISWGRNSPETMMVGVNPCNLADSSTELLSGMAVYNPVRVRVYKA